MQFDPFWMFRAPLSGDVAQRFNIPWFSPKYTINFAGSAAVEEKIVSEIASYGKQIGWLNEVVLAIAKQSNVPLEVNETLGRMTDVVSRIEAIKDENKRDAVITATNALDRLQREQPDAYACLLKMRKSRVS